MEKISRNLAPLRTVGVVIDSPKLSLLKKNNDDHNGDVLAKEEEEEEQDNEYKVSPSSHCDCPFRRRYRNQYDLVLECEFQFKRYCGDWVEDEYFLILDNAYLVS